MLTTIGRAMLIGALGGALSMAPAATEFVVVNNGLSSYTIDGQTNPSLTLMRDSTYIFHINATGHPFWINTAPSTGTGNAYSSGVTNNGIDQGDLTFIVPAGAPDQLFYNCQFHSPMTGSITIGTVIATGPVAYYPFNGDANDATGNGHNSTVTGPVLTTDRYGNANSAYSFDGLDDYMQVSHATALDDDSITVTAWIKPGPIGGRVVSKDDGGSQRSYLIATDNLSGSTYQIAWELFESDGSGFYMVHTTTLNVNSWYFVAGTFDGILSELYFEGVLVHDSTMVSPPRRNGTAPLQFGKYNLNSNYWDGAIDDVRIYNRALSAAEIDSLYQLGGWPAPDAPTNLTAAPGGGQITLTWSPNGEADFLRYRIYGGTDANPTTQVDSTTAGINDTTATIPGLSNGTTYYYRITAVDSAGNESGYSNEVNAVPAGLVAYYPFNGNANDESGNGNDGTVYGAALAADRFGNANSAYSFDGVDDYVDVGSSPTLNLPSSPLTIIGWIKGNDITWTNNQVIFFSNENNGYGIAMMQTTGNLQFAKVGVDASYSDMSILDTDWHQVAVAYSADDSVRFYFDGMPDVANPQYYPTIFSTSQTYLIGGRTFSGYQNYFDGRIDDIRIYNRALNATEIDSLYRLVNWLPPDPPTNLTATSGDQQISLTWSPNSEADFLRYRIYGGTAANPTTQVDSTTSGINDTTVTISGLRNGTTYYYRITAVNTSGNESVASDDVHVAPSIIPSGLVAYLPFAGNALDGSGKENDGAVNGATLTQDRFRNANSAYSFDGINDDINLGDPPDGSLDMGTGGFCFSAWVNKNDTLNAGLFSKREGSTVSHELYMAGHLVYYRQDASAIEVYSADDPELEISKWIHVALAYNGGNQKLYYYANGRNYDSTTVTNPGSVSNNSNFYIGRETNPAVNRFNGFVDDVRIYNRFLSSNEILALAYENGDLFPPLAPSSLTAAPGDQQITLTWSPSGEADFLRYRIYGGTTANPTTQVDSTTEGINDTTITITGLSIDTTYYYRITAMDSSGNESDYSAEVSATVLSVVDGMLVPGQYALRQNYPNPFNPSTMIRFDLPEASRVQLIIYDAMGREVRTLLWGEQSAGYQSVNWDGADDRGQPVSSGIYFYRLQAESYSETMKMVLLR
ncbi:MAG: fibronectin type III domain-containing protein [Candidatus Marinimicrobia bacterium]|nr:fibronectin type III domain-containing protein [Candidatus Neomarinimicrobiota bacterium]